MNDLATNITNSLLQLKGKSADHLTHALKMLGGGEDASMLDGLLQIVNVMDNDKKMSVKAAQKNYGIGGMLIGTLITGITGGCIWHYKERKKRKKQEDDCKRIVQTFDNEVKLAAQEGENDNLKNTKKENKIYCTQPNNV